MARRHFTNQERSSMKKSVETCRAHGIFYLRTQASCQFVEVKQSRDYEPKVDVQK